MNLQYISDSKGKTTGVFIPINEWKKLILKFKGIDLENVDIPAWHIQEVRKRLKDFQDHPEQAMDFEQAMDAIEKQL
jgi:hypothetical protein